MLYSLYVLGMDGRHGRVEVSLVYVRRSSSASQLDLPALVSSPALQRRSAR